MVISTSDKTVPTKNQIELKKKWSPIILSSSWLGHTASVIKTWLFTRLKLLIFLNKGFKIADAVFRLLNISNSTHNLHLWINEYLNFSMIIDSNNKHHGENLCLETLSI